MKKESMIQVFFLLVLSMFVMFACDEKPKNPIAEYGNALIDSYKKGQMAGEEANLNAVKKSIEAYHATHDKYPQSLDEIKDLFGSNEIDLSKYDYNPNNGMVSLKK
jgi:competence protein ComGC